MSFHNQQLIQSGCDASRPPLEVDFEKRHQKASLLKEESAFTLLEILIVTAILGIVVTIALPVASKVYESSQLAKGVNNIRQVSAGILTFASDNNSKLPYCLEKNASGNNVTDFSIRISGYLLKTTQIYGTNQVRSSIFTDPLAKVKKGGSHFSAHPELMPSMTIGEEKAVRLASIQRPGELILIMDGAQDPTTGNANAGAGNVKGIRTRLSTGADPDASVDAGPNRDTTSGLSYIRWRVKGERAAKFAFVDGHVSVLNIGELKNRNICLD